MASLLFTKDAELGRFDELVARIPSLEPDKPATKPDEKPQPGPQQVIVAGAGALPIQGELTNKEEEPRRGTFRKEYMIRMKAGGIYYIDMRSTDFTPYMRLELGGGAKPLVEDGANARIITPRIPADGDYKLVVSSTEKSTAGRYVLQISQQQVIFIGRPHMTQPAPEVVEKRGKKLDASDLAELANKQSNVRIAAFKNLAGGAPDDLAYRPAQKIANYLLLTEWEDSELNAATGQLSSLAKCRHLFEALADVLANGGTQRRTEAVVGSLVGQQLRFARDEDWRTACRKLLLQRALELSKPATPANNDADKTADILRDLYKQQGLAFGVEDPDFEELTEVTAVLERLIRHVAAKTAAQATDAADKAYVVQIDRQLRAAQFAAANDLEHVVRLQRIWIKVLTLALRGQAPASAQKAMTAIQEDLAKKDRESGNLLDQLRSGEEKLLRVWAAAHDLKLKG
jgi:hypothetical protein